MERKIGILKVGTAIGLAMIMSLNNGSFIRRVQAATEEAVGITGGKSKSQATTIKTDGETFISEISEKGEENWFTFITPESDSWCMVKAKNISVPDKLVNFTYSHTFALSLNSSYEQLSKLKIYQGREETTYRKLRKNSQYYLNAYHETDEGAGQYKFQVLFKEDPDGEKMDDATQISINTLYERNLAVPGDVDYYKFTVPKSGEYYFNVGNHNMNSGVTVEIQSEYEESLLKLTPQKGEEKKQSIKLQSGKTYFVKGYHSKNEAQGNYNFSIMSDNLEMHSLTMNSTARATISKTAHIPAKVQFTGVTAATDELLDAQIDEIKWSSNDSSIVSDSNIKCERAIASDKSSADLTITFVPKKTGKVKITGKMPNGDTTTCEVLVEENIDDSYIEDMRNFITNQGTNNTLKYLCSDSNFTNSVFVYRNDQKFGSMLTNFLTDAIYRGDEGWKDLFTGQTSVEEAEKMIAGLLDSYQLDSNALSKSKTAHKYASLLVKEFNEYIRMDAIRGMLNDAQFNQLQNALKEDDVAELLITQKYDDIIVTLLEKYDISFNADINQKLYGFMESQQLAQALSDGMKIMGKGLTVLDITKNTFDKYYELESVMNADENYCEMLKYLKENCKYSVVQEAAGNLYEATKNEMTDILDEVMKSLTTDVAGEVVDSILDKAAKASIYTNLIKGAIDLGVGYTNAVLNVGSVQELKDAMRTEAYIGNCLSGWVLKNQREFYSTLESTDISKQNEAGERLYYSLYMLWQTRAEGEKTLQSMLEKAGSNYYSKYYTISKEISYSLDSMKDSIFEKDRMNALLGITVACPVDVEICDSNGKVLVTVKDGQESKGYVDGIYYNVSLQPFEQDYVKYISLPENETYSIRCVGKNAGQVDCSITGITDNGTVVQKYFENVTVDKNVVIEMNNVSTDVNDYVVTDKKADDKKQYTFNTIKAGDLVDENGNLLPDNNLTPAEGVKGDADGNGTLDLQDAQMVLKAALKIIPVSDIIINNVDVDGQEGITLTDAQMVLKAALKIIKL